MECGKTVMQEVIWTVKLSKSITIMHGRLFVKECSEQAHIMDWSSNFPLMAATSATAMELFQHSTTTTAPA